MSYNSRRGTPNQNNIGSRRPATGTNFVSSGQLTPQKGGNQQNQQRGFGTQQTNKPQQSQQSKQQVQQNTTQPKNVSQVIPQQQLQPPVEEPVKAESIENGSNQSGEPEKKKWTARKIPKKEKIKRRNARLSKLLQPKCAVMILNELVKNPTFTYIDYLSVEGVQFKAIVTIDDIEHTGFGKSKASAKNAAAETAIKHIFKNRKFSIMDTSQGSEDDVERMDTSEAEGDSIESTLPWKQVASFAIFKLFDTWGDIPKAVKDESSSKKQPAKKLPENAETLNPIMLVNQMCPYAAYEELKPTGSVPNIIFHTKCIVDDKSFTGSGQTKKLAKKNAAQQVCRNLLAVQYPPEVCNPAQ